MEIKISKNGDLDEWARVESLKAARAITRAVSGATASLKSAWRASVAGSLGERMGNAVRSEVYPEGRDSVNAAGMVFVTPAKPGSLAIGAAGIVGAHSSGVLIQARQGVWLAIPLPAAGRAKGGARITPSQWKARTGRELRFVRTGPGRAVLVADDMRINTKGRAVLDRRKGKLQAKRATTAVPLFALVRQVKLSARPMNLMQAAAQAASGLPARVTAAWGK